MKRLIATTLAIITIGTAQAAPVADTLMDNITPAISASAADYEPAKVTGLSAKRSYTTATISWDKVSKAKGYRVYMYDTASKKYKKITTIKKNSTTSYQIKGLKAGTEYKFKVRAYRKANGKTYWGKSGAISVITKSYAPTQVKGVTAKANSKTAGTLTWTKIANAKGYRVYVYDTSKKKYTKVTTLSGSDKTSYKVTGLKAGTAYKFKVRAYRKVDGKTYWGKPSAAVKLTTKGGTATSAAVDKAYQSLIKGDSTAADREIVRQDLIAYMKKNHPEYTLDERIYAFSDKSGKPTVIYAESEGINSGNCCFTDGVGLDQEQTAYYYIGDTSWIGEAIRKTLGDNYSLESLAKQLRQDCYEYIEYDVEVWKTNRKDLDRFNVIIYLFPDDYTGLGFPAWTIINCFSNADIIEGV